MRAVTLVSRLSFSVPGCVAQHAVCLADVDNDGAEELVVATMEGDVLVFKGQESQQPWKQCSGLGFISAVGVGDLFSSGYNVLAVVSGCGWINVFKISPQSEEVLMTPVYTQRLPANIKDLIVCDINCDNKAELVVSLTDRVVRIYCWIPLAEDLSPPESPSQPKPGGSSGDDSTPHLSQSSTMVRGRFECAFKWESASQIGTITSNIDEDGMPCLLIAQPGGAFMKLRCKVNQDKEESQGDPEEKEEEGSELSSMCVEYEPLGVHRRRNPNVSAEILGGFLCGGEGPGTRYAIVTLDGTVMLVDRGLEGRQAMDSILWNLQVDHQLMCLSSLDVTGDGLQEVVACSWDGQTYIISQDRQAVRFQFEECVSTFTAGLYSLDADKAPSPVLVYVTFSNKVHLYYDLGLEKGIKMSSLLHCPGGKKGELDELLAKFGVDKENLQEMRELNRFLLYEFPKLKRKKS